MFLNSRILLTATATCGLLASSVSAQQGEQTDPMTGQTPRTTRSTAMDNTSQRATGVALASDIIGENVINTANDEIADVEDLVVSRDGKITVVIDRAEGGLVGVPFALFTPRADTRDVFALGDDEQPVTAPMKTTKIESLVYTGDPAKLAGAPGIDGIESADESWMKRSHDHFGKSWSGAGKGAMDDGVHDDHEPGATPDQGGATGQTGQTGQTGKVDDAYGTKSKDFASKNVYCIEKLVGKNVESPTGENLGNVKDVVVDLAKGEIAYVVISSGGLLGMGATLHGVSLDSFSFDRSDRSVTLNTDRATLDRTPGIDIDRLPARPNLQVGASSPIRIDDTDTTPQR